MTAQLPRNTEMGVPDDIASGTMNFGTFVFSAAGFKPMRWQARLACGADAELAKPDSLGKGTACTSRLIDIPTGCGKTAGAVFAWLWNRVVLRTEGWPRRLVYCLPMRTLVEQIVQKDMTPWLLRLSLAATSPGTAERARVDALLVGLTPDTREKVLAPIGDGAAQAPIEGYLVSRVSASTVADFLWLAERSPIVLMGGEELDDRRRQWDLHPEKPAILVGTQDMLLSRALNRGYGMSRYRWPVHFALLNTDCLWVLDEVQLMGSGLTTSLQLQAWRDQLALRCPACESRSSKLRSTLLPTRSWWMSATLAEHWFKKSVAMRTQVEALWKGRLMLGRHNEAQELLSIPKTLRRCPVILEATNGEGSTSGWTKYARAVAGHLADPENRKARKNANDIEESEDILTIVICNTVDRAVAVYNALRDLKNGRSQRRLFDDEHLFLLHSRFRGCERAQWVARLTALEKGEGKYAGPRILVATQVIEAGVDVSATALYTELCPLASLIQRLGRCARRMGQAGNAFWIDFKAFATTAEEFSKQVESARPYEAADLAAARKTLVGALNRVPGSPQARSRRRNHA